MPNDLPTGTRSTGDVAHDDGLLMHELTVLNTLLGRYVLHFLDVDAGRTKPIPTTEEHALADRLALAAESVRARATGRDESERS